MTMKNITPQELLSVIALHAEWLTLVDGGHRADLSFTYLVGTNFCGAQLWRADFRGAYLSGADFCGADLREADFREADLKGAHLRGADFSGADLMGADFREADLRGADLKGANFRGADLKGAHLRGADFRGAYLRRADFKGAYLMGADFRGADLKGADFGRGMTRTKKEHDTSLMELYYDDSVRSVVDALGTDYHAPFHFLGQEFFAEQLVVEDHPDFAWVWEEEQ